MRARGMVAVGLCLVGCSGDIEPVVAPQPPVPASAARVSMPERAPAPQRSALKPAPAMVGSRWRLVRMGTAPVAKRGAPWIEISRDVIGGFNGCNHFGLRYADPAPELRGHTSGVGTIQQTLIGCAGEAAAVEASFTAALMAGHRFERRNEDFEVRNARGEATLRFQRWPRHAPDFPALVGTHWCLQRVDGTAVAGGARQTLAFPSTVSYRGFAGCRSFFGTFSVQGDILSSGSLGMEGAACADAAAMDREGAYTEYLGSVVQIEQRDGKLLWTTYRSETLEFTPCAEAADGA